MIHGQRSVSLLIFLAHYNLFVYNWNSFLLTEHFQMPCGITIQRSWMRTMPLPRLRWLRQITRLCQVPAAKRSRNAKGKGELYETMEWRQRWRRRRRRRQPGVISREASGIFSKEKWMATTFLDSRISTTRIASGIIGVKIWMFLLCVHVVCNCNVLYGY